MAATAWLLYNLAKLKIGNGNITLGANINRMLLFQSASSASTFTWSTAASISNQVAAGNGYTSGGQTMGAVTWAVGASAKQYAFDCSDLVWTATGGTIPNIKFAVINQSTGGHAIAWSRLTTSEFTLAQGNTLTVQLNSAGIFTMT